MITNIRELSQNIVIGSLTLIQTKPADIQVVS